jgi:hypothetical protein
MAKTASELELDAAALEGQLRTVNLAVQRARASEQRATQFAKLSPAALKIEADKDQLYLKVMGTPDGQVLLADLETSRPQFADEAKERIDRAKNAASVKPA